MATRTVRQTGGDFSTLSSALSDPSTVAGDVISIEGTWTIDDGNSCTVSDDNITIQTDADSRVDPKNLGSPTHYRLRHSGYDHCIEVDNNGCVIDGLEIKQATTGGSSEEGIRVNAGGKNTMIKNCVIHASSNVDIYSDGIYTIGSNPQIVVNVENTVIFHYRRGGIHAQSFPGSQSDITFNVNSCSIYKCGEQGTEGAGIQAQANSPSSTTNINAFNTIVTDTVNVNRFDFHYYSPGNGTVNFNIHNCICSDSSISARDPNNVGCLENRSTTDSSTPGAGDWIMYNDLTGPEVYDLTLQDDPVNNDAREMHTDGSGAGMSVPATDIEGDVRNSPYDCGADAVSGAAPSGKLYIGSDEISTMYAGTTGITAAYVGSEQIFP